MTSVQKDVYDMKDQNTNNIALLCMVLCGTFGAFAADPLRGPEAWLELMGGNVRKDGLRLDLRCNQGCWCVGQVSFLCSRA